MGKLADAFAINVRKKLREFDWTAKDLAQMAGMSPAQVSNYLNAKTTPTFLVLERIAEVLKVEAHTLLIEGTHGPKKGTTFPIAAMLDVRNYIEKLVRSEGHEWPTTAEKLVALLGLPVKRP